jgi:hypothetical protein
MSTTAIRKYAELKLELLETERAMDLKAAIMHDEVTGIARRDEVYDEEKKEVFTMMLPEKEMTELWWAMLAGKNRLESHRAGLIYELARLEDKVEDDKVFLIILATANGYGVDVGEIIGKSRKTPIAEARAVCWALMVTHTNSSQAEIADIFGVNPSSVSQQHRNAISWLFEARDKRVWHYYELVKVHLAKLIPGIDVETELVAKDDDRNHLKTAS